MGSENPQQENNRSEIQIGEMVDCGSWQECQTEILTILQLICPDLDPTFLTTTCKDIVDLFEGRYPGYQASNTKYHDLDHTFGVALALIRLTHGHMLAGRQFADRTVELGMLAALFHDTGLLMKEGDSKGSGAKYTIGHEDRSVALMSRYLLERGRADEDVEDGARLISCTILALDPEEVIFLCQEMRLMGYLLGSADLMAQMAERSYLEKLPLLFEEFKEGGVNGFDSTLDLFKKTESFYKDVALHRLNAQFHGVARLVRNHFKARWHTDRDLYEETILKQINYLKDITEECRDDYELLLERLRRRVE